MGAESAESSTFLRRRIFPLAAGEKPSGGLHPAGRRDSYRMIKYRSRFPSLAPSRPAISPPHF